MGWVVTSADSKRVEGLELPGECDEIDGEGAGSREERESSS